MLLEYPSLNTNEAYRFKHISYIVNNSLMDLEYHFDWKKNLEDFSNNFQTYKTRTLH